MAQGVAMDRMFRAFCDECPLFFGVVLNITFRGLRVVTMFQGRHSANHGVLEEWTCNEVKTQLKFDCKKGIFGGCSTSIWGVC